MIGAQEIAPVSMPAPLSARLPEPGGCSVQARPSRRLDPIEDARNGQGKKSSLPCPTSAMGAREFEMLVGSAARSAGRVWTDYSNVLAALIRRLRQRQGVADMIGSPSGNGSSSK